MKKVEGAEGAHQQLLSVISMTYFSMFFFSLSLIFHFFTILNVNYHILLTKLIMCILFMYIVQIVFIFFISRDF